MAQNMNSKIPSIPKPSLLKPASSTLNLKAGKSAALLKEPTSLFNNFNAGSTTLGNVKPPSRTNLRRSKSYSDLNTADPKTIKPTLSIARKPIKRPALTVANAIQNKITKVSKPEPQPQPKVSKQQPKFAPYDYKNRFYHLKELHEKLKVSHRDLKEQNETISDQNEDLLVKNTQLQTDFDNLDKLYTKINSQYELLKEQKADAIQKIKNLQSKSDKLEAELKERTEVLESTTEELTKLKKEYKQKNTKLASVEEQLDEYLEINAFMKEELFNFEEEKRRMHNIIQEMKGNIRVFCRIRPPLLSETEKLLYDVNYLDEKTIELYRTKDKKMEFSFDLVFGPDSSQSDIFEELSQLVQSALDGYNVCVFAYGQTGSGKTYTMEGEDDEIDARGMIPRSIDTIFKTLKNMERLGWTYKIKASFLEIYNENINDLLDPKNTNLDIRMCDAKGTDVYVSNLTVENIRSADHLKNLMKTSQRNRAVACTENNERSSRSHSVTKISLAGSNDSKSQKCIGNLNLIDLAGSEKFHTNETTRLRETTNINKSLSNLSNVILCLVKKTNHIPYRNSKLTHLLMPSLRGNSKTLMLVNISPLDDCYNESVNSLRFASTVNQCKTGSIKKQKTHT